MDQAMVKSEDPPLINNPLSKEQAVQRMFTSIARRYDLNNSLLSLGLHHPWKRAAVVFAGLREGNLALDLCTGTADLAIRMAHEVGSSGRVIGLDFNAAMLEIGRRKVLHAGLSDRVTLTLGNTLSLQFQDRSFDAVTVALASAMSPILAVCFVRCGGS